MVGERDAAGAQGAARRRDLRRDRAPAALDLVPIVVTALLGVLALILTDCLNVRQAARAVDRQIVLIIAASLALGTALEATGGAPTWRRWCWVMAGAPPSAILSVLFLIVAAITNILSNNAAGVLFTPVAVNLALSSMPRCSPSRSPWCSAPAARSRRRSAIRPTSW